MPKFDWNKKADENKNICNTEHHDACIWTFFYYKIVLSVASSFNAL